MTAHSLAFGTRAIRALPLRRDRNQPTGHARESVSDLRLALHSAVAAGTRSITESLTWLNYFHYYRSMKTSRAVAALAALAQESRLAVFRLLIQAGATGMAAGKISETIGIPPSSLSFHLKELTHASLVTSRQEGRFVIYAANLTTAADLVAFLTENCCGGQTCDLSHATASGELSA